jgi:hypothetical protein
MDTPPIKEVLGWLEAAAASIPVAEATMERRVDKSELRRMIAAGEYRLDARAIAEAMLGRADRDLAGARGASEVFEAGEADGRAGGVE